MNATSIHDKLLLARLTISAWNPEQVSKQAAEDAANANRAQASEIKAVKKLIDKRHPAYKAVTRVISEIRTTHSESTLNWTTEGMRILPIDKHAQWSTRLQECTYALEAAVNSLAIHFPEMQRQAERALGDLYNPADYPAPEELQKFYRVAFSAFPLPSFDPLLNLTGATRTQIEADTRALMRETIQRAQECYLGRIKDALTLCVTRLSGTDIFRDTMIENLRELCEDADAFNIAEDPNVSALADRLLKGLASMQPDTLRKDEIARARNAEEAKETLAQLEQITNAWADLDVMELV